MTAEQARRAAYEVEVAAKECADEAVAGLWNELITALDRVRPVLEALLPQESPTT